MKTNIPDSVIPTELSNDNSITTVYTTNTLIPRLGPLAIRKYKEVIKGVLIDYSNAVTGLKRISEYEKKYKHPIILDKNLPQWQEEQPRFNAIQIDGSKAKSLELQANLAAYASPSAEYAIHDALNSVKQSSQPSVAAEALVKPGSPALNIQHFESQPASPINKQLAKNLINKKQPENKDKAMEELWDISNTLHIFAQDNRVVSDMAELGLLQANGELVSGKLKPALSKPDLKLAQLLVEKIKLPRNEKLTHIEQLLTQTLNSMEKVNPDIAAMYKRSSKYRGYLSKYIWGYFKDANLIGNGSIIVPTPDDTAIVNSREWAFQRAECLKIHLSRPEFRGPISADSVAPNSVLTSSETRTVSDFSGHTSSSGSSNSRTENHSQSYSQRFQMELNNMTEEGVQSESEFRKNSTLFNTLRDQRRASIDQVISQISSENETAKFSQSVTSNQISREYISQGVDSNQAVTELSFQVVSPVDVEVRLEDVSLAWCPRVISPFINLHRLINNVSRRARREYLDQNQISDPVRPVEVFDKASFKKKKHARGRHSTQGYEFSYEVPDQYSGWEIDRENCTVGFRNGTGDDYNWDEAWNWDDLENWDTYFQSLDFNGTRIAGYAVLTTTDPEYFNRGFLMFNFAVKKITEETRVSLLNYSREKQEAENQRIATRARANQYARLRRDEIIESYDNKLNLMEEAFKGLIDQIFSDSNAQHKSYYTEVIRSCINWAKAGIYFESGDSKALPFPHLLPNHYLNTPAIRLTLPIHKSSEQTFFDAIEQGAGNYHNKSAKAVESYVNQYREHISVLKTQDPSKLLLDSYKSEMILGNHLEAVLSKNLFEED